MKKLLGLMILLASCRGERHHTKLVIEEVEKGLSNNPHIVRYKINNDNDISFDVRYFYDSAGKFNVGDTVKFTK